MKRRHLTKAELIRRMHRGLRPKLHVDQVRDLALAHVGNLDTVATGQATEEVLWQWIGGVLTWSRVATVLKLGEEEMTRQLELATSMVERYGRVGRVGFSGPEYQLAKEGLQVMDQLAAVVDRPTAIDAADWSEDKVNEMAAQCARREGKAA